MARLVVVQHQHLNNPSFSYLPHSLSDLNGARFHTQLQYKKKVWKPKGGSYFTSSSAKKILMTGSRFVGEQCSESLAKEGRQTKAFAVPRRNALALILSGCLFSEGVSGDTAFAQQSGGFREYIDTFDGYSLKYPQNWIQVRGAGADIFFRDPYVLDENISVELSSPSSSRYKSVEDLGPPEEAAKKVLKQYLTEFMSTRLGVRRESNILSTTSKTAEDGRLYYQVEVNIKSYANNNELAVMPQDRVPRLEWNRRYLSVLGVENNRLYELRLQTPENVFAEEESDLRQVMDSFRVNKVAV
ncbi:PsbP family [Parasponia andersonii]|uniref:PsbP family n=1 Tax=Parasponia andersonii TaxID=3476 RepID=A0A2P5D8N8_PARAD|nr:PsbP family [Parasponia andersonii]